MSQQVRDVRCIGWLAIVCATLATCGCGGSGRPEAELTGTITVNGQPLETGRIVFRPATSGSGNGGNAPVQAGRYRLSAVPLGTIVFTFSGSRLTGKTIPGPGGAPEPERISVIPRKVLDEGVEREIAASGVQDFALSGP